MNLIKVEGGSYCRGTHELRASALWSEGFGLWVYQNREIWPAGSGTQGAGYRFWDLFLVARKHDRNIRPEALQDLRYWIPIWAFIMASKPAIEPVWFCWKDEATNFEVRSEIVGPAQIEILQ